MVELSLDGLSKLNDSMNDLQYWFTIVLYVLMGCIGLIILYSLYKILCCGVCLIKCVTCPCRSLFKNKTNDSSKDDQQKNLLSYHGEKPTSLV